MMKKRIRITTTAALLMLLSCTALAASPVETPDIAGESLELGIYTSLYAGAWLIEKNGPFADEPLIGGETGKPYVEHEKVPASALVWWTGGTFGLVILAPNNNGTFNSTSYKNAKGLYESLAYCTFITQLTKSFFGRKRPSYDNYPAETKEKDGRMSFISGHSSTSFTLAVYGSLFIACDTGSGIAELDFAYRAASAAVLVSGAVYTGWSRVHDNRHHTGDVITGAAAGTVCALAGYMHQNGWIKQFTDNRDITIYPVMGNDWYGVALTTGI